MTDSPKSAPDKSDSAKPVTPTASKASSTKIKTDNGLQPNVVVEKKSGGGALSVIAILFSLAALGGAGYTWYENKLQRVEEDNKTLVGVTQIGGEVARLADTISRLQTQQSNVVTQEQLTNKLLQLDNTMDRRLDQVTTTQKDLASAIDKINSDLQQGVNSYVIDDVSQLLRLANNKALFAGDAIAAIKALELADIQLKEMADPRFSAVRKQINDEIGVLRGIQQLDVESVTAQLQALANQVPLLKLENERPTKEQVVLEHELTQSEQQTFMGSAKEFFVDLVNFFDIQKIDQPPKPLLAPEQRYFLNQNLQLQLAKAELAALQQRPPVYTQSIESALNWINDYFDLQDPQVQDAITQLNALKTVPVKVVLPSITGSYDTLQSIKGGQ